MKYYNMGREITEAEAKKIAEANKSIMANVAEGKATFEKLQECIFIVMVEED